jgi:uncharacterized NAD-dependent epimerase/dehydratase family protein
MNRRIVILAEGKFGPLQSKTANQAIRYLPEQVVAVIDGTRAGVKVKDVLGFGGDIPVLPDLGASMTCRPDTLLIGIAPSGGQLPGQWRETIVQAIRCRLDVISGLHTYISDDPEFVHLAEINNVKLFDLRKVPKEYEVVAKGCWKTRKAKTILTVGTDCNVGKMTVTMELHREFLRRGLASEFVATGQTGIFLSGKGVAVDSIIGDFVSGAIELEIERSAARGAVFIHVEGQGSLTHQGYSSVTLGLLHGVMPDAMVLVHHPIRHFDDYGFCLDDVPQLIRLHETILNTFKPSRVAAIAINTVGMTRAQVSDAKDRIASATGLPVGDVLTSDVELLADSLLNYFKNNHTDPL